MDTEEYQQFENICIAEKYAKQEKIAEIVLFEYVINISRATIQLVEGKDIFIEMDVVPIGSWGVKSGSWMWGWANPALQGLCEMAMPLKELGAKTGRDEFLREQPFPASAEKVSAFTAISCHHLNAIGVYATSFNNTTWWFAIAKLKYLKPLDGLLEKATQTATKVLLEKGGIGLFNSLRKRFPKMRLHLPGVDLRGEQLPWAQDLHVQGLFDLGYLTTHEPNDLTGANLSNSRLDGAIMREVTLCEASFDKTSLIGADLSGADVRGASFRDALLNGVNFTRARLTGADFSGAELAHTLLTDVDLSEVKGLDEVHHGAPSEISMSTLIASRYEITPTFLRKAGVSRGLMEDLMKGKGFSKKYQTCFLSYSSKDREFARQLYGSLSKAGVSVFWDSFDVIPGEALDGQIMEAIREHDRLLVVLSEQSMASKWVLREIEFALHHKIESLVPVRLCPIEDVRRWIKTNKVLPDLAELFPVLDFSGWKSREEYDHAFSLLLKSFSGGVDFRSNEDTL